VRARRIALATPERVEIGAPRRARQQHAETGGEPRATAAPGAPIALPDAGIESRAVDPARSSWRIQMPHGARPSRRTRDALLAAPILVIGLACAAQTAVELPPEGACPSRSPRAGSPQDATPPLLSEGMRLGYRDLLHLEALLPIEVWRNRDQFFAEDVSLEVGACHRRYPVPAFFAEATRQLAARVHLDADGNLHGHVAGLPFPPERIDPDAPDAGLRFAWDLERRYRGAGPVGHFRLVDMPSRIGGIQTYLGAWFLLQTGLRADLADTGYAEPVATGSAWVAGGHFDAPSHARHLAWRQLRPLATATQFDARDDTFVFVPALRKVRRAGSTWVDGIFVPRYRVTSDGGAGAIAAAGGVIDPSSGGVAATENLRRGFEGLALRPNAYQWRLLGFREVLAPLNVTRSGYPIDRHRDFGPSGLSVGSDRFDVRYAAVIQGALKAQGQGFELLTIYVDVQTMQPLYVMTKRRHGRQLAEVGVLLHRFSGDLPRYPPWPDGSRALVFDPVAAVFYDSADGGSGWRRESYDVTSVPRDVDELRRLTAPSELMRGH
jgi:Protein of unknown function (DUF1329)